MNSLVNLVRENRIFFSISFLLVFIFGIYLSFVSRVDGFKMMNSFHNPFLYNFFDNMYYIYLHIIFLYAFYCLSSSSYCSSSYCSSSELVYTIWSLFCSLYWLYKNNKLLEKNANSITSSCTLWNMVIYLHKNGNISYFNSSSIY